MFVNVGYFDIDLVKNKRVDLGTASKFSGAQNGANNRPCDAQVAPYAPVRARHACPIGPTLETLKNTETFGGSDLCFAHVFRLGGYVCALKCIRYGDSDTNIFHICYGCAEIFEKHGAD